MGKGSKRRRQQEAKDGITRRGQGKIKAILIKNDGPYCYFCKQEFPPEELTVDHMIPLSAGGSNLLENKVLACIPHQIMKGNKDYFRKLKK